MSQARVVVIARPGQDLGGLPTVEFRYLLDAGTVVLQHVDKDAFAGRLRVAGVEVIDLVPPEQADVVI